LDFLGDALIDGITLAVIGSSVAVRAFIVTKIEKAK